MKKFKRDQKNRADGLVFLSTLRDRSVDQAWFDPQHRDVLDRQKYGNEGKRQRGRASLPHMSTATIGRIVGEIERTMKTGAYLFLWTDKYLVVTGHWRRWLSWTTSLSSVDMMTWNKTRIGMGRRFRCMTEFLIVLQKGKPSAKGWTDHSIGDCYGGAQDRDVHPHAKPEGRIEDIIRGTTKRRALVLDPAAGGYGVLRACQRSGRQFIGCDVA